MTRVGFHGKTDAGHPCVAQGIKRAFAALIAFAMSLSVFAAQGRFTWTGKAGNNLYADKNNWTITGDTSRSGPSWTEYGLVDTDAIGGDVTIILNTDECHPDTFDTKGSHKVTFLSDGNARTFDPYHLRLYATSNEFDVAVSIHASSRPQVWYLCSNATFNKDVTISDDMTISNCGDDGAFLGVTPNAIHFYGNLTVAPGKALGLLRAPYTTASTVHFHGPLICDDLRFGLGYKSGYAHFYSQENQIGSVNWCYSNFVCDNSNVFPSSLPVSWPTSTLVNPYNGRNEFYWEATSTYNAFNLNGWDQTVANVAFQDESKRPWIISGTPAVLTLNGSGTAVATANVGGKASICVDSPDLVQEFLNSSSTTEGGLEAKRGTLRLAGATTFANVKEVAVGVGATFDLESTSAGSMAGLTNVTIAAGGTFKVGSGIISPFGAGLAIRLVEGATIEGYSDFVAAGGLWVDGKPVDSGDYVAKDSAEPGTKVDWIKGSLKLSVVRTAPVEIKEWTWSGAGANNSVSTEENWAEPGAPNFSDGSAYLKFGDASHGYSANVGGPITVNGVFMDYTQTTSPTSDFSLGGTGKVTMNDGGFTGSGSRPWVFRFDAPLEFARDQVWDPNSAVAVYGTLGEKVAGLSFVVKSGSVKIGGDANTFTGPVFVDGGTLALYGAAPFAESDSAVSIDGSRDRTLTPPTLELGGTTVKRPVVFKTDSSHTANVTVVGGTNEITKALTVSGNAASYLRFLDSATLVLSGGLITDGHLVDVITAGGELVIRKVPFDDLYLYNDSETHLSIEVAGCRFNSNMRMGGSKNALIETRVVNGLAANSPITLAKDDGYSARWNLCGKDQQCGNLQGSGANATVFSDEEATLTVNQASEHATALAFDGPVTLCKRGSAKLTLTGASAANGAVRVEAGTLELGEGFDWAKNTRKRRLLGDFYIAKGATLSVGAGLKQRVRELYLEDDSGNWVKQEPGTWGTNGQYHDSRITGSGLLNVLGSVTGLILVVE